MMTCDTNRRSAGLAGAVLVSLAMLGRGGGGADGMASMEKQVTTAGHGHVLTNVGVWSPDSKWVVYDTRSDAAGAVFDGDRIEQVNVERGGKCGCCIGRGMGRTAGWRRTAWWKRRWCSSWGLRIRRRISSTGPILRKGRKTAPSDEACSTGVTNFLADPDLAAVVKAWPNLPPAIRAGILAMVQAAKGGA